MVEYIKGVIRDELTILPGVLDASVYIYPNTKSNL